MVYKGEMGFNTDNWIPHRMNNQDFLLLLQSEANLNVKWHKNI